MTTAAPLETLLNHPAIWRGSSFARVAPGVPTGFNELDNLIPGAGWPVGAMTEIYAERSGVGELQLIMPAVARLTQSGQWVSFIGAPHVPYAPALASQGVDLARLLLVNPASLEEKFWAAEQALRTSCSGAVLLWAEQVPERVLRRLQLAAEEGGAPLLFFRSGRGAPATVATLRLHLSRAESRTVIHVLKRRGGGLPAPLALDLHPWVRFPARRISAAERGVRMPALS